MPVLKLTLSSIQNAIPLDGKEAIYFDTEVKGFSLKVTPANTKIFFYQYRIGGRGGVRRRVNIGKFPSVKPDEARKIANQYAVEVAQKKDPYERLKEEANSKVKSRENSFGKLFQLYADKRLSQIRSGQDIKSIFEREFLPSLQNTPVTSLNRTDISKIVNRIQAQGKGYAANKALSNVKTFVRWLVSDGYLQGDPISIMQKPFTGEEGRDRVLTPHELKLLWQQFNLVNCQPFSAALKLLVLLGQRRTEVASMQWSHVDLEKGLWSIPKTDTKNKLPHVVPLIGAALGILKKQKPLIVEDEKTGKKKACPFVFSTTGKTPISGYSHIKRDIDVALADQEREIVDWRIHDLRRTMSTNLGDLGYSDENVGILLNHASRGVTAIYNRSTYLEKKKEMLTAWQNKLASMIPEVEEL